MCFAALLFMVVVLNNFVQSVKASEMGYLYGVTTDAVDHLPDIVNSLSSLPVKPTTRIVFDEYVAPSYYSSAVNQIYQVSYVMGELLDSYYVKQYSIAQYKARVTEYLNAFPSGVDIWEVGNEVNGEWLGTIDSVVAKITDAYDQVEASGGKTALTLYYNGAYDNGRPTNNNCWENPANHMMTWAKTNLPDRMKSGLDYVLVSYYESDCLNIVPDWQAVFDELATVFPNSKLGFGEVGTTGTTAVKEEYLRRYYSYQISTPNYIGGHFWWYFKQDMVPKSKYMWTVLAEALANNEQDETKILLGDTDGDGTVGIYDYNNVCADFGSNNSRSDFDHDGKVDLRDYNILVTNFGRSI